MPSLALIISSATSYAKPPAEYPNDPATTGLKMESE